MKYKLKDIVYLCNDRTKPDKIEVRVIVKIEYKKATKEVFYTLDNNNKEYKESELLTIEEVNKMNHPEPKHKI